jgi:hypothetical protein
MSSEEEKREAQYPTPSQIFALSYLSLLRGIKAETKGRDLRQTEVNNTSILF